MQIAAGGKIECFNLSALHVDLSIVHLYYTRYVPQGAKN